MTAFRCIQCGESVTAVNALALRLMMQGAKQPMCTVCRSGIIRTVTTVKTRLGREITTYEYPCGDCGKPLKATSEIGNEMLLSTGKQPLCRECQEGLTSHKYWKSYEAYLASPEWKALADQRRKIDGYKCRLCYSPERLEVHHRTYDRQYHEDIEDLTTLCHECHEWYELWKKSRENGRRLVSFTPVTFEI